MPLGVVRTMPFLQIHSSRVLEPAARRRLGYALTNAYGEYMQTDPKIVNVGFVHYAEGDLARYDAPDREPREMTVVTGDIRAGRTPGQHEALGRAITALCAAALGVAEARVAVYLTEHDAAQIYRDGGPAPHWSAAEAE
jgi:phenylpyruvate tautomerase PptA (4-oxalocrotonate tautomerase family)